MADKTPHINTLSSFDTEEEFELLEHLGDGGFGSAFKARRVVPRRARKAVCIKFTKDAQSWHREAYFGEILRESPGIVHLQSTFVGIMDDAQPRYCSVFELGEESLEHRIGAGRKWTEKRAVSEWRRIVAAVAVLHENNAIHRDITPMNVLVMSDGHLKLCDFGIALHGPRGRVLADAFNTAFAPPAILGGKTHWGPQEDVWQLGRLLALLLGWEPKRDIGTGDLRALDCSDESRTLIYRCLAPAQFRLRNASEILRVIRSGSSISLSRTNRIRDKVIAFTGPATISRAALLRKAKRAGSRPVTTVTGQVDLLVVCGESPLWAAGSAGTKILRALELQDEGNALRFISERHFHDLAKRK
jgi:serine/threonine protein kinase